ncbi:MAG: hypothetical protein IIC89_03885 [Chloroflexi bacterium]|nr:hypothetical protein [Chloroflexota bacterium]
MKKRVMPWWGPVVMGAVVIVVAAACSSDGSNGGGGEAVCGSDPSDSGPGAASEIVSAEDVLAKDPGITDEKTVDWGWMFELAGVPQIQIFGMVTGDGVKFALTVTSDGQEGLIADDVAEQPVGPVGAHHRGALMVHYAEGVVALLVVAQRGEVMDAEDAFLDVQEAEVPPEHVLRFGPAAEPGVQFGD